MKVLKVIPAYPYTNERMTYHGSPVQYVDWETCIRNMVLSEEMVDPGVDLDIIIYRMYKPGGNENLATEFIHSFNGRKIFRGEITTIDHINTEPHGFKIIRDSVLQYHNDYDYFIFQEDDISIMNSGINYAKSAIDQIITNNIKGCVVFAPIKQHPLHFGGFFGLIPMNKLKSIIHQFPNMPHKDELLICNWFIVNNQLNQNDIVPLIGYNNFPDNHGKLQGYNKLTNVPGEFLYHLGK